MKNIIIIPYRNRVRDLKYFLQHSYPLLNKNLENLEIIIVEQINGLPFNRAKVINIGFKETDGDYYYTHDVDINPLESTIINIYKKEVKENAIMGIYTSHCNTLGGIIKFKKSAFETLNGFSNNFWGWGCEDKDLQNRAEYKNIEISKNLLNNNLQIHKYFTIFKDQGDCDNSQPHFNFVYKKWQLLSNSEKEKYILSDGLTHLSYKILKEEMLMEGVKKITVDI